MVRIILNGKRGCKGVLQMQSADAELSAIQEV
jgi:hypothetical protein